MTDLTHEEAMKRIDMIQEWTKTSLVSTDDIHWLCSYARTAYLQGMEDSIDEVEKYGSMPNWMLDAIRARIVELQTKEND